MTNRPLLLGLDNPHSTNPRAALLPRPKGSAGHRLLQFSGLAWSDYRRVFERANVCDLGPRTTKLRGRTILALGREVWRRLDAPSRIDWFCRFKYGRDTILIPVPHPSGLNHYYNDPSNVERLKSLLQELYKLNNKGK